MGRDVPDGVMRLSEGRLEVDWTTETSLDYFEGVRASMRAIAGQLGGTYADNPLWWAQAGHHRAPARRRPDGPARRGRGVCDQYGEVFGHPGLYVLDGVAAARTGRRQPVADDRRRRRPRPAPHLLASRASLVEEVRSPSRDQVRAHG